MPAFAEFKSIAMTPKANEVPRPQQQSEELYWQSVYNQKIQTPINISPNGDVNLPPANGEFLKVVCISDTHDRLDEIGNIPAGDILIHAGDFTNLGNREEIQRFNKQMARFPHKHKIVIAGNHELGFDDGEVLEWRAEKHFFKGTRLGYRLLEGVTYLQDDFIEIDGIFFFGSPWHPMVGFPFYGNRQTTLLEKWRAIPEGIDVLITHTPPVGYLDLYGTERRGCRHLLQEVEKRLKPKFHVFGHVHDGAGAVSNGVTTFINASQMRKGKIIVSSPKVFYIAKPLTTVSRQNSTA